MQVVLCVVVILVIGATMLLNSPRVQRRVSVVLATELENRIGTRVELGGVRWLFPNDIVVDSLIIDDQEGARLLSVRRVAAKVEWTPLIKDGQISIRNIRLFYPEIAVYKDDAEGEYNYQFLVDAFSVKRKREKPTRLNLRVNSLLIRHARLKHDVNSVPCTPGRFNMEHLGVEDLSTHIALKALTSDSLSLIVRQLSLEEQSGLNVKDLYLRFVGNKHGATLANFRLDLPHSTLQLDTLWASYSAERFLESLVVKGAVLPSVITPSDIKSLVPQVGGFTEQVHLSADFIGSTSRINLKSLALHTRHKDFVLEGRAAAGLHGGKLVSADVDLGEATLTSGAWTLLENQLPYVYGLIPVEATRVGGITVRGEAHLEKRAGDVTLHALSDVGSVDVRMDIADDGRYTATFDGRSLDVARVVPQSPLARTNLSLTAQGNYNWLCEQGDMPLRGTLSGLATDTRLFDYAYEQLAFDCSYSPERYEVEVTLDDRNGTFALAAAYDLASSKPAYMVRFRADTLDLHAMNLIDIHEDATFSAQLKASMRGEDFDHMVGQVHLDSFIMHRPGDDYMIEEVSLYATDSEHKMLSLHSDFMDASVSGDFTYESLSGSLLSQLHQYLPSLCQSHDHEHVVKHGNLCFARFNIYDMRPLRELLLIPIELGRTASVEALINDHVQNLSLKAEVPQLEYGGNLVRGINLNCYSEDEDFNILLDGTLHNDETQAVTAHLMANAKDDNLHFGAVWNSNPKGLFDGTFSTDAHLAFTKEGDFVATIQTDSSEVMINQSVWYLSPFRLKIAPEQIAVHELLFAHDETQYLSVNGTIAESHTDTLQVELNNLDLGYLLSLVELKGISFDGGVSGHLDAADLYADTPYLNAQITVNDFSFCEGVLGDVAGDVYWNQDSARLEFLANVNEVPHRTSVVDGYVDLADRELCLDISADSLNVSFLNKILSSFMNDVKGNASGRLMIGGPLKDIDLDGALLADVEFNLTPTNVSYSFNDTLRFSPGKILFNGIEAYDNRGQKGIVNGEVTHERLTRFSADLYIDAQNILGIDLPDTGSDNFYTTIFGTGEVHVVSPMQGPLEVTVQAQPEKGSLFALNLASQNVSSSEAFVTFYDRSTKRNTPTEVTLSNATRGRRGKAAAAPSNINITAHITPDAMLKLVMNQAVDDHISAYGYGDLQIDARGDDISLYGTYTVNRGFYRLSLQDVINKNFDVLGGSTVTFDGDPMNARLDITARHMVSYVPFKDLSPDITGNVHVNCLLRIGGTLSAPTLTFDLELPQGTEEEKAILRSYTGTEEQTSMQFIYLLGLGKFYTPDVAQNAAGTGNMEAFISSTISGQLNNLLSNIISNSNWNFASNIRAENMIAGDTEDNWENMEVEGILEGRLLDNRLLINGNFGYRDNPMYATNFIGDFDIRYLLTSDLSLKGYNKTNDRYFSKTSLTTQGVGLMFQRDFDKLIPNRRETKKKKKKIAALDAVSDAMSDVISDEVCDVPSGVVPSEAPTDTLSVDVIGLTD